MSNKRHLWKADEYVSEIERCNYIIKKTNNYKTIRDFTKYRERLKSELREYQMYRAEVNK